MSSSMDELFSQASRMPMTVKVGTKINGAKLHGKNELPLMSQSIANSVQTVVWSLASRKGQKNIQKTIERSVNRKFLPFVNALSTANRKTMHHLYEWNKVGVTSARLFDLKIPSASRGKTKFSMVVDFRPSKSLVPLTEAQQTPGPTGETVKRVHVFHNKAMVMEYGLPVVVRPKNSKYMAFDNPPGTRETLSGLTFTSRPVTINYADRPTYQGLEKALQAFFSGYGKQDISNSVRGYSKQVTAGAGRAAHVINVSMPSDGYAKMVASRIANALVVPVG